MELYKDNWRAKLCVTVNGKLTNLPFEQLENSNCAARTPQRRRVRHGGEEGGGVGGGAVLQPAHTNSTQLHHIIPLMILLHSTTTNLYHSPSFLILKLFSQPLLAHSIHPLPPSFLLLAGTVRSPPPSPPPSNLPTSPPLLPLPPSLPSVTQAVNWHRFTRSRKLISEKRKLSVRSTNKPVV